MKTKKIFFATILLSFCFYFADAQIFGSFSGTEGYCGDYKVFFSGYASGGVAPYTFVYDFGDGTSSPSPQNTSHTYPSAGTYTVSMYITDSNLLMDTVMRQIQVTGVVTAYTYGPNCVGGCDGSIYFYQSLYYVYSFQWSTGDTSYYVYNLCAGTYTVTLTDTSGSSCVDSFNVTDPPPVTISGVVTPTCGGATGAIDITVSGGNPYYYYSWSNGATTQNLTGLTPGTYSVTVADTFQCTATASFNVSGLNLLFSITNSDCGANNGSITVTASGGNGPYTYIWSPAVGTGSTISGLSPGYYALTVADTSGCTGIDTLTIIDSCGLIKGHVFRDQNGNGTEDVNDAGVAGITVQLGSGQGSAVTNQNGDYTIIAPALGTFTVSVVAPQNYHFFCSGTVLLPDSVSLPAGNLYTVTISGAAPVSAGNDFGLAPPPSHCGTISGLVFNDLDGSGSQDVGETGKNGITVRFSTGQYAVTDFAGMYSVEVPLNVAVTVSIASAPGSYFCGANQPYYVQTFPLLNGTYTVTLTSGSPTSMGNDFGVHQTSASYDVGVYSIRSFSAVSKGTFTAWMDFKSNGTTTDTCRLRVSFDPLVDFISASIQPTIVTGTYIEWVFPPGTTPSFYCMEMEFFLDPNVSAGTQLVWTGTYLCGSPDGCPGNDSLTVIQTVILDHPRLVYDNGFNFMEVEHTGTATGSLTTADSVFSYVINFQNTGTDTVYHLTIVDTLSPNLNIQTISTPFSSDAYKLHIPASNILIWEFNNILLPDSATDFQHSYGFVQYNIHLKRNLNPGTRIEHRGAISFNYGEPYFTNETSLIIKEPDDTTGIENFSNDAVKIYPNPGSGIFKILLPENIGNDSKVKVYDVMGAMVFEKVLAENSAQIVELNLGEQADGLYFVRIESGEISWRGKVILMM